MHRRQTNKHENVSSNREQVFNENEVPNENVTLSESRDPQRTSAYQRFCDRISFIKYIFLILIIPPILNYASLKREIAVLMPAEGQKIDMGWGQKMYSSCLGEGLPTVILDAPTGGTSDVWYLVQQELSKITKVCVYDRAGLGFSDLPFVNQIKINYKTDNHNRRYVAQVATLEQMTNDLHHLVTKAQHVSRPFILVGSETGGLIARHYSMIYPEDVSDIVILNPLVEDLFWRQKEDWDNYWNSHLLPSLQTLQLSASIGMSRIAALVGLLKPDLTGESVPKEVELRQLSHLCNPTHMEAVFNEHMLLNTSFNQMNEIRQVKTFQKNISVTVINSRKFDKVPSNLQKAWQQSQLYLRQNIHPTCKHFVFDGSMGQLYNEPETIVSKVEQLLYKWRIANNVFPTVHTYREQESLLA